MELFPTEIAQSIPYVQELSQKAIEGWAAFDVKHLVDFIVSYKWINFYIPEFQSLAELHRGTLPPLFHPESIPYQGMPFLPTSLTDHDTMEFVTKRSVFVNGCHQIVAKSTTLEGLMENIKALPREEFSDMDGSNTFSIQVTTYNSKLTRVEQERVRRHLMFLKPTGKVNLSNPSVTYTIFIDCVPVNALSGSDIIPEEYRNQRKVLPYIFYFTRQIAAKTPSDWYCAKFDLSKRAYIGPTSCDNYLAFAMVNLAQVNERSTVVDPFSGTGSILLSAAKFSPLVIGQDLDFNVLHAKMRGKTSTIWDNFQHHQFQRPELLCSDSTRPPYRLRDYTNHPTHPVPLPYQPVVTIAPGCVMYKTRYSQPIDEQVYHEQLENEVQYVKQMHMDQSQVYSELHRKWLEKQQQQQQQQKMNDDDHEHITDPSPMVEDDNDDDEHNTPQRFFQRTLFDAIICDPPYGIRARANKIGTSSKDEVGQPTLASSEELEIEKHYPTTVQHALHRVILDLFDFAAQTLHVGKRLCFLFPSARNLPVEMMPYHPCFKLIAHPAQPLSTWFTRRCMVYEKVIDYNPALHKDFADELQKAHGIPLWSLTVLERARGLANNKHWFDVEILHTAKAQLEEEGLAYHQGLARLAKE